MLARARLRTIGALCVRWERVVRSSPWEQDRSRAGAHDWRRVGVGPLVFGGPGASARSSKGQVLLAPLKIQKRFSSHISLLETETLNLILDPPHVGRARDGERRAVGGTACMGMPRALYHAHGT